jgi:hypothetical protein
MGALHFEQDVSRFRAVSLAGSGFFWSNELHLEIGEFEAELDGKTANDVVGDEFSNENAGFAVRHVALEVREDKKFLLGVAEANSLDQPEMQNGQPALGVLDPIENGIDLLDHFRVHRVLPPVVKVIIL